jgi:hypothetical protein
MKFSRYEYGFFLVLFLVAGCGESGSTAAKPDVPGPDATGSVFDPMQQTFDRAKRVEDLSANRTSELDSEVEKSQ